MNEWHRKLRSGKVERRNLLKDKPVRRLTGGYGGNSHQRRKQRRAFERTAGGV